MYRSFAAQVFLLKNVLRFLSFVMYTGILLNSEVKYKQTKMASHTLRKIMKAFPVEFYSFKRTSDLLHALDAFSLENEGFPCFIHTAAGCFACNTIFNWSCIKQIM